MTGIAGTIRLNGEVLIGDFELSLTPGWTCLLGPSGSGKSTLLRLLGGLPTGTEHGGSVSAPDRIGWMAQADLMQPRLTVLNNVMLLETLAGRKPDPARARHLLEQVGLPDFAARFPDTLSGGQKQRVALARTLMSDAALILLDEPFSALDPATRAVMQDLAFEQFKGRTVLLVTHDPFEALRLGAKIWLLTGQRLNEIAPLSGTLPHSLTNPDLAIEAASLLGRIREAT